MTITLSEFEDFHKSVELMKYLRAIPLEIIEFYLENSAGYTVKRSKIDGEKTVMVRPIHPPAEGEAKTRNLLNLIINYYVCPTASGGERLV